uniref:Uncharacterized protein n=1 Tax=Setaria italica TaxID=4555 RepID=K3YFB0_SETIT
MLLRCPLLESAPAPAPPLRIDVTHLLLRRPPFQISVVPLLLHPQINAGPCSSTFPCPESM